MSPADSSASASGRGPTQRRKPHNKSRTGCAECRRRRVKCNEERPTCRSCLRHGILCVYPHQAQAQAQARTSTPAELPSLPSPNSTDSIARSIPSVQSDLESFGRSLTSISPLSTATVPSHCATPTFTLNDLGLLHYWTVSTSKIMFNHPRLDLLWQVTVPQIAAQHDFLMHGILCLAALHLAHEKKHMRSSFIHDAATHHNLAIQGFNEAIGEMSEAGEANAEALFAFSSLNIICVFGLHRPLDDVVNDASWRNTKNRILGLEWVNMIRGVGVVLAPIYRIVWNGPLRVLLDIGNWEDLNPADASGVSARHLREIQSAWQGSNDAHVYDETLCLLIKCFMFIEQFSTMDKETLDSWGHNRAWAAPVIFLHHAPESFCLRLRQRQPPALIMFVYLGAALHGLEHFWFMEGWGKDIVEVVGAILGDHWRPWISWPLEVIQSR